MRWRFLLSDSTGLTFWSFAVKLGVCGGDGGREGQQAGLAGTTINESNS